MESFECVVYCHNNDTRDLAFNASWLQAKESTSAECIHVCNYTRRSIIRDRVRQTCLKRCHFLDFSGKGFQLSTPTVGHRYNLWDNIAPNTLA